MKKILLIVSSTLLLANSFMAQDSKSDSDKKVRFGLKISPTPTWLRSNDAKAAEKAGAKFGFGFGLQAEFRINSTASFVTGIGGDFLGGKQNYKSQGVILDANGNYVKFDEAKFGSDESSIDNYMTKEGYTFLELQSRSVKTTYVTIPLLLKLMTKEISGVKYFGVFGGNLAVQTKFKATDDFKELNFNQVTKHYESGSTKSVSDIRPSGDLIPFNFGLNAGIGAEYNLSGSTSVFLSINYLRGFVNQYQPTSDYLMADIKKNLDNQTKPARSKQSAFVDGIQINVGILF